jgi:hypothetical protein
MIVSSGCWRCNVVTSLWWFGGSRACILCWAFGLCGSCQCPLSTSQSCFSSSLEFVFGACWWPNLTGHSCIVFILFSLCFICFLIQNRLAWFVSEKLSYVHTWYRIRFQHKLEGMMQSISISVYLIFSNLTSNLSYHTKYPHQHITGTCNYLTMQSVHISIH